MKRFVYADNAATTRVGDGVFDAMCPYLKEEYGNPSSLYSIGRSAQRGVDLAREQVAQALGCEPGEIYFTSGGSEADNWAIRGAAQAMLKKGKNHIITSVFEHHAVLHTVQALEKQGFTATYLPVGEKGLIDPEAVRAAITPQTALVSIMYANNEIGTIQPVSEIAQVCKENGVWFHTDAVQAVGNVPIDVKEQQIDMLSLSGHKIHAAKGVGALYMRKGVPLPNLIYGGAQERNRRAGTENVAGIVGLGYAIEHACKKMQQKVEYVSRLRDALIQGFLPIERCRLNGDAEKRLCGNVNVSFEGVEGESLLLMLDMNGICASSGSACTSGSLDPSHVLLALGLPHEVAHGSLRLTLSEDNTMEDVAYILEIVPGIISRLRAMSPLWERIKAAESKGE